MHGMNRVSSVNQPQNDRKSAVFCKRPARIELFRDEIFGSRRITPRLTGRQIPSVDLTSQARGVCPLQNDTSIQCKCTVECTGGSKSGSKVCVQKNMNSRNEKALYSCSQVNAVWQYYAAPSDTCKSGVESVVLEF